MTPFRSADDGAGDGPSAPEEPSELMVRVGKYKNNAEHHVKRQRETRREVNTHLGAYSRMHAGGAHSGALGGPAASAPRGRPHGGGERSW